jgi:4-hydroxybenzoate polyprenyltransferase
MKKIASLPIKSLLIASHLGPTVLVVTISFCISISQFSLSESIRIALAIFAGQLVVGWSNEVIDYPLDRAARRVQKPLVSGEIGLENLRLLIPIALTAAGILSIVSPLDLVGTGLHLLGILSAMTYNLKLKATILSPLPYIFSFGLMPWAIFLAAGEKPPVWLYLALSLFTTAFHFLNVIKDLQWDIDQGVRGLPQRIGKQPSIVVAVLLAGCGVLALLFLH